MLSINGLVLPRQTILTKRVRRSQFRTVLTHLGIELFNISGCSGLMNVGNCL